MPLFMTMAFKGVLSAADLSNAAKTDVFSPV
jgi:hypothetical protein